MNVTSRSIEYSRVGSPIGPLFVAHDGREALAVRPAGDPVGFESWLHDHVGGATRQAVLPVPVMEAISAAINGRPDQRPSLSGLGELERLVLGTTLEVPRGQVRSYGWVAARTGGAATAREVGAVLAANPLPQSV